ncbi:hypothetical protein EUV02_15505 [Polymorphobacter arshaanensis]|uniref:Uncharacterized protein n=1 Tax=Glacieibacterium arshaanense TaxID=2511025 RepID=A0A4Y9EJK2_9SPHN|nr:hypothetical protein [Polymorphobacter arshaanensis]TFU00052.1 hypothetical protein EUV02_15505 [Polymorphobacter arshaanensis]
MIRGKPLLLLAVIFGIVGCEQRKPDNQREIASLDGKANVTVISYQPRGTIEGYLTLSFAPKAKQEGPQIKFGHMLNVKLGWLDERRFAIVYDVLEIRQLASPVFPTGEAQSAVEIIPCNRRYIDCRSLETRLNAKASLAISQFPDGDWPKF